MRKFIIALAAGATIAAGGLDAQAMPISPVVKTETAPLTQVRFGCGRGFHPNIAGVCVPNFRRFGFGVGRVYGYGWRGGWRGRGFRGGFHRGGRFHGGGRHGGGHHGGGHHGGGHHGGGHHGGGHHR